MKQFIYFLTAIIICISSQLFSQDPVTKPAKEEKKDVKKNSANIPAGFYQAKWGSSYKEVKDIIKGRLVYTNKKDIIISKEKDDVEIIYKYGFFYQDPKMIPISDKKAATDDSKQPALEPKLFYVALEFPYLAYKSVSKKLIDKYGEPTIDTIKKNRGVLIWDSENTVIVLWVDSYEKQPFCRKINYISKNIAKELEKYNYQMFSKKEIQALNGLLADSK